MTKFSFVATVLLTTTFLSAPAWAEWTPENKDGSVYNITAGTSSDYNFTTTDGKNTSYWKINLNTNNLKNNNHITYSTNADGATGSFNMVLPNQETATIYYKYTSSGYEQADARVTEITDTNVYNKVFQDLTTTAKGGAIYNHSDKSDINVESDFINNSIDSSTSSAYGGALSNYNDAKLGNVSGVFIDNSAKSPVAEVHGGALSNWRASIGNIDSVFINNSSETANTQVCGGTLDNVGSIQDVLSDFLGNSTTTESGEVEGTIFVGGGGSINTLSGNFIGNTIQSQSGDISGGVLYNFGEINELSGTFIGNTVSSESSPVSGGVVNNLVGTGSSSSSVGTIHNITGSFIGNSVSGSNSGGGAITNTNGTIENIDGLFISNSAVGINNATAGAIGFTGIYSNQIYGTINGDFIENHAQSSGGKAAGGAIYIYKASAINGNFINNYATGYSGATGGAIATNTPDSISGNFIGNYAKSQSGGTSGGAVWTRWSTISGNFDSNYSITNEGDSIGGAVYSRSTKRYPTTINNFSFTNNYAQTENGEAHGGAIWASGILNLNSDNYSSIISNNYVQDSNGKSYEGMYISGTETNLSELNINTINNGKLIVDDIINGSGYNLAINGDGTGVVKFNNLVKNVTNFTLGANSITHLGVNSKVYAEHMNVSSSAIITGNAVSSPIITVDVEVDKANNTVNTGQIYVDNDIEGSYRVLVNSLNPDVLDNTEDAVVPFLFAPEDDTDTSSSFSVARVIGSPYMWDGSVNAKGEDTGSTWYLNLTEDENPDYVPPEPEPEPQPKPSKIYAPEVLAGIGLHEAAIEQTRSVVSNVRNKTSNTREYCDNCTGMYSYEWDGKKLRNIWALAQGKSANIDKPVHMEAKIWGIEAGFDVQSDLHNTLGVFASYRKGQYDLSGKGSKLHSNIGSEIDINSYLAGLYYRYDHNFNWLFSTIYGGMQEAEVETEDHIAKFDTDGIEFGASIEIGRTIPLARDLTLDPSFGLYYTQVNFDDTKDNVGKHYEWDDIKHLEAELGAKLEKQFDNAKVYIKPSVIQTLTDDDSVIITGLSKADTYHDQTLGRIEIGGRYGFTDALSAYAWANYTFGSSYDAYALGAGLNYAW